MYTCSIVNDELALLRSNYYMYKCMCDPQCLYLLPEYLDIDTTEWLHTKVVNFML